MSLSSKKRPHSLVRSDIPTNDLANNDVYQTAVNPNAVVPLNQQHTSSKTNGVLTRPKLIQYIEENIIGRDVIIQGPWGLRRSKCIVSICPRPMLVFSSDLLRLHSIRTITVLHRKLYS